MAPKLAAFQRPDHAEREALRAHRRGLRGAARRRASRPSSSGWPGSTTRTSCAPGAKLDAAAKKRLSEINQRLADALHELQPERARRRERLRAGRSRTRPTSPACRSRCARRGRGRGRARGQQGQVGDRQHALERRAVPHLLRPARPAREGLAHVRQPRRQRRRARQQRDHHRDPEAARRARQAARLRDARALAPRERDGQDARARDGADGGGVDAGGRRACARRSPTCRPSPTRKARGITIEPWDYRYYAEKVRKAKYDLDENEVKPYLQLEKLREGMFWVAGELFGFRFTPVDRERARLPPRRARLGGDGRRRASTSGLWYFDPYARPGKRSGAWMNAYRNQERFDGEVTTIVSNNANFVKGKPGEPVLISWDDADDAVPRVRPRAARPELERELSVAVRHRRGARLRRVPVAAARALARRRRRCSTASRCTTRPASRSRRRWSRRSSAPRRSTRASPPSSTSSSALVDMKLHLAGDAADRPGRVRARDAGRARHAARDRDAPPHAAVQPRLRGRRLLGRLLQLPVGRHADAPTPSRRSPRRGGPYDKAVAKRLDEHVFSVGQHGRPGRGVPRLPRPRRRHRRADAQARLPGAKAPAASAARGFGVRTPTTFTRGGGRAGEVLTPGCRPGRAGTHTPRPTRGSAGSDPTCRRGPPPCSTRNSSGWSSVLSRRSRATHLAGSKYCTWLSHRPGGDQQRRVGLRARRCRTANTTACSRRTPSRSGCPTRRTRWS